MTVKKKIKDLIALSESSGWGHLHKTMQDEILQLALNMARRNDATAHGLSEGCHIRGGANAQLAN